MPENIIFFAAVQCPRIPFSCPSLYLLLSFYKFELKIKNAYGISVGRACRLEHIYHTGSAQYPLEVMQRIAVAEVDLCNKPLEPLAFDDIFAAFFFDRNLPIFLSSKSSGFSSGSYIFIGGSSFKRSKQDE